MPPFPIRSVAWLHPLPRWCPRAALALTLSWLAGPLCADIPLRVQLTGQSLIKHDLRAIHAGEFPALADFLRAGAPHVSFTNLETAIKGPFGGAPTRQNEYQHAADPVVLDCLKELGFNLLSTGNNHSWDLGTPGILSTLHEVDRRGFTRAGTGRNLGEASAAAFMETPAGRVALVALASGRLRPGAAATAERPGVNEVRLDAERRLIIEDAERVLAAIRFAATQARAVIVYQHDHYWEEDRRLTPDWKKNFARACVDAGAAVFVSHGVPQLHGLEIYRDRPIFYGLGSLIFHTITKPGHYAPEVWQSVVADLELRDGRFAEIRLRPVLLNEHGADPARFNETRGAPRPARGADARRVLEHFAAQSAEFGTVLHYDGDAARVALPPATLSTNQPR